MLCIDLLFIGHILNLTGGKKSKSIYYPPLYMGYTVRFTIISTLGKEFATFLA